MTHHQDKFYDPKKTVNSVKFSILEERYGKILDIIRSNAIYRDIVIPDFVFLRNKYYDLCIDYPLWENHGFMFNLKTDNEYLSIVGNLTDDEFIKFVYALDDLIDGDIDEYLDELYPEIDDQERIDYIKKELELNEDPLA